MFQNQLIPLSKTPQRQKIKLTRKSRASARNMRGQPYIGPAMSIQIGQGLKLWIIALGKSLIARKITGDGRDLCRN
jgi:hypothetical protein